ncbi:MAG: rhodanese-like domain-containing protein [Gammaproteobacteria bacterium]
MRKLLFLPILLLFFNNQALAGAAPVKVIGATTAQTMQAKMYSDKGFTFIDMRPEQEFQQGHIPGAKNLNLENLTEDALIAIVKKDDTVVFYCSGMASDLAAKAAEKALEWGWSKVFYYRTGFTEWKNAGLKVE